MARRNKYIVCSKIPEANFRELLRLFSIDLSSQKTTTLINLSLNTVNRYFPFCEKE